MDDCLSAGCVAVQDSPGAGEADGLRGSTVVGEAALAVWSAGSDSAIPRLLSDHPSSSQVGPCHP